MWLRLCWKVYRAETRCVVLEIRTATNIQRQSRGQLKGDNGAWSINWRKVLSRCDGKEEEIQHPYINIEGPPIHLLHIFTPKVHPRCLDMGEKFEKFYQVVMVRKPLIATHTNRQWAADKKTKRFSCVMIRWKAKQIRLK